MIIIHGQDPFDYSPSSKMLLRELKRAGFRRSELEYLDDDGRIPEEGHVLCFGSQPFKNLTGSDLGIGYCRGELYHAIGLPNLLVYPTFSPGYLYRNRNLFPLFRDDLEIAYVFFKLDTEGVVV